MLRVLAGRQYQDIQLSEMFRGEYFPFLSLLPLAMPCTESPARHGKKGPSQPKNQMQNSSETPAREVSHGGYRRKFCNPTLGLFKSLQGKASLVLVD